MANRLEFVERIDVATAAQVPYLDGIVAVQQIAGAAIASHRIRSSLASSNCERSVHRLLRASIEVCVAIGGGAFAIAVWGLGWPDEAAGRIVGGVGGVMMLIGGFGQTAFWVRGRIGTDGQPRR